MAGISQDWELVVILKKAPTVATIKMRKSSMQPAAQASRSKPSGKLMAEERGLVVDVENFNIAMNEARERSRNAQNKVFLKILELIRC